MGLLGEAGAAGDKQGGDGQPLLSLQCPSSCWKRWALTPQTPSCSRTICTVMWGEGYAKSSAALCLCLGEPSFPWPVYICSAHRWHEPCSSIPAVLPHQLLPRGWRDVLCWERRSRRGAPQRAGERFCREEGVRCREGDRQGQAAGQWGPGRHLMSQPASPCSLQVAGTKGPGSPGSGKTG